MQYPTQFWYGKFKFDIDLIISRTVELLLEPKTVFIILYHIRLNFHVCARGLKFGTRLNFSIENSNMISAKFSHELPRFCKSPNLPIILQVVLMRKARARIWKKIFPTFKFVFLLENPTHWGLETALCPIFVKPVLDIFAVCSMVLRMNLFYTPQSHFMPKKSKLPTKEDWFKVFP